ncbi:putative HTH transcriptional regulator [Alkalibacillus flavidus]|uniref:HTH transcriptional regulator n=1 Tax=Alkalibacillus flavidus TaxID=546021 RepID=A0ABV2KY07_9BACI
MENESFWEMIRDGENAKLECKLAENTLPKEMWYTYSAFANTDGGVILLGVEEKKGEFFPVGTNDVVKLQQELWNQINNPQKISQNILRNEDVQPIKVEGKDILKINVPRANREQRPVYIGQNPYINTWRRNYEGDYSCSEEEVKRMIAEQSSQALDNQIIENFSWDDLNMESFKNYRQRFSNMKPDSKWNELSDKDFLKRIGGWSHDRNTNKEGLTVAGLLVFGEEHTITDYFPHFFLDYREKLSDDIKERWSYRVTSHDATWSGNLYDFFFKVIQRLVSDIDVPFELDQETLARKIETPVHSALREAVLNSIIHANYYGDVGVVIEKEQSGFRFSNPGTLRMPIEKAIEGGNSDPRNPNIFKIFAQLGYGERSGYGLESIYLTWEEQHWQKPVLHEEFRPERTTLTLMPISLMPNDVVHKFKILLQDRFHLLDKSELFVLVKIYEEGYVTNARLQALTQESSSEINKRLSNLVEEGLLESNGKGRSTYYTLSNVFSDLYDENGSIQMTDQEVEFDIESINDKLWDIAETARESKRLKAEKMQEIILTLCSYKYLTINELSDLTGREGNALRRIHIRPLVENSLLELRYPETPQHRNQAYKTKEPSKYIVENDA